jgi:hypothetical protein
MPFLECLLMQNATVYGLENRKIQADMRSAVKNGSLSEPAFVPET